MKLSGFDGVIGDYGTFKLKLSDLYPLSKPLNQLFQTGDFLNLDQDLYDPDHFLVKKKQEGVAIEGGLISFRGKTKNDSADLRKIYFKGTKFRLASVKGIYKDELEVEIFSTNEFSPESQNDPLEILLSPRANRTRRDLEESFVLQADKEQYFVMAQGETNDIFYLLNQGGAIRFEKSPRHVFDVKADEKVADDLVYGILDGELVSFEGKDAAKIRHKTLICRRISFKSVNDESVATAQKIISLTSNPQIDKYLRIWAKYSGVESEIYNGIIADAGKLDVSETEQRVNGEIRLHFKDPVKVEHFCTNAKRLGAESTPILLYDGEHSKYAQMIDYDRSNFKWIEVRFEESIPRDLRLNSCSVELSDFVFETSLERRSNAVVAINEGTCGIPELSALMSGKKPAKRTPRRELKGLEDVFANKSIFPYGPTQNQKQAIKIALETPDFAIIQGPPGTGKTTVISAILACLEANEDKKEIAFGTNLTTAYQRKTTQHLSDAITKTFGLPSKAYMGKKAGEEVGYHDIQEWVERTVESIEKANPGIEEVFKSYESYANFSMYRAGFDPKSSTYPQTYTLISDVLKECSEILNPMQEGRLRKFQTDAKEKMGLSSPSGHFDAPVLRALLRSLPTSPAAFKDGGLNSVNRLFVEINDCRYADSARKTMEDALPKLKKEYEKPTIDFSLVQSLIDRCLVSLRSVVVSAVPVEFNNQVASLLEEIESEEANKEVDSKEKVIADYLYSLKYNPLETADSVQQFCQTIAATHQVVEQKEILARKSSSFYKNVIVDEAARSCPADLLIPISKATERIILVGDENQLPQFINEEVVQKLEDEMGDSFDKTIVDEPMFTYLKKSAKKLKEIDGIERVIRLKDQFRMPRLLGNFIGYEFYSNKEDQEELKKDHNLIKLKIKPGNNPQPLRFGSKDSSFIYSLPGLENVAMCFMGVKAKNGQEEHAGTSWKRPCEAELIARKLKTYLDSDSGKKLTYGVMSFYLGQIEALKEILAKPEFGITEQNVYKQYVLKPEYENRVSIGTVDSFQGLQNDIIFLSVTRCHIGEDWNRSRRYGFLANMNRLCVALSRAQKCAIVVGDPETLTSEDGYESIKPLADFVTICKDLQEEGVKEVHYECE